MAFGSAIRQERRNHPQQSGHEAKHQRPPQLSNRNLVCSQKEGRNQNPEVQGVKRNREVNSTWDDVKEAGVV